MAEIYDFPGPEARYHIQHAVQMCARGKIGQMLMNDVIAQILRRYRVKSLVCGSFRVRDVGDIQTPAGTFPVVTLEALAVSRGGTCPACGAGGWNASWLRGDKRLVVFCRGCGCVYVTPADVEVIP
jgi:hypothetical protein